MVCSCINIKNKDPPSPLQCTIKTSTFLLLPSRGSDSHENFVSCVNTIVLLNIMLPGYRGSDSHENFVSCVNTIVLLNIMLPGYMALYQTKLSNMKIRIQVHITPIIRKVLDCYVSLYCNFHLIVKHPVKI